MAKIDQFGGRFLPMTEDTNITAGSVTAHRHDALFNDFRIKFMHVPTGLTTNFAAIITEFADRHDSSWDEQNYYGRMDPVAKFKNTKRTINFAFSVVNDDPYEAAVNMARYQKLVKMLYPKYNKAPEASVNPFQASDASTMSAPPLIGIKFANLIQQTAPVAGDMLIGWVDGFEFNPDQDASFWYSNGIDDTVWEPDEYAWMFELDAFGQPPLVQKSEGKGKTTEGALVLPRKFDISVSFHVLHTHPMGFSDDGNWNKDAGDYPHGSDDLVNTFPTHLKETQDIEYSYGYKAAKVPLSIKKSGWDNLMGALFGPPKI